MPPVLGRPPVSAVVDDGADSEENPDDEQGTGTGHRVWIAAMVLLLVLTGANVVWTFREPLLQVPRLHAWLQQTGWLQVQKAGLLQAPDQIRLTSRDMHSHPTRAGILVLSLTFVNLAPEKQVFPQLEITLLDAASQPVARRRLQPTEYLRRGANIRSGLASDTLLPVLLELADPGARASGFEIRFL